MGPCRLALLPAAGAVALAIAACGGAHEPSAPAQTGSGKSPGAVTFAKCMRAHGVPQFPDPGGPRPEGSSISVLGAQLPPTISIDAPAFRAALSLCLKRLRGGHPRPAVSAAQKSAMLGFARCMRTHGVPSFPDPTFPAGGGIGINGPSDAIANSPAFQHAQKLCGQP